MGIEKYVNDGFKDRTTISIKMTIPKSVWEEWNKDCVENFNDTRWLKMKFDHEFRNSMAPITGLIVRDLDELKDSIEEIKKSSEISSDELEPATYTAANGVVYER